MKPAFLRWVISLVALFSLIPFQSGRAHIASSADRILPSISSPLSLEGWFHILWGDPREAAGPGELFYLLVDDQGRSFYLDLGAAGKSFSQLLLLNGERVSLQGTWSDLLRDLPRNPVRVEDIRAVPDGTMQGQDLPWQSQDLPWQSQDSDQPRSSRPGAKSCSPSAHWRCWRCSWIRLRRRRFCSTEFPRLSPT